MDTTDPGFSSFHVTGGINVNTEPSYIGRACVYFTSWGTYIGHMAHYPKHVERINIPDSAHRKDVWVVPLLIKSWDRLDIVKEAYTILKCGTTVDSVYSGLPCDWTSIQQTLQSHPDCTRFDLRVYPNHPEHKTYINGKDQLPIKLSSAEQKTLQYIRELIDSRTAQGANIRTLDSEDCNQDVIHEGEPLHKRKRLHLTARQNNNLYRTTE